MQIFSKKRINHEVSKIVSCVLILLFGGLINVHAKILEPQISLSLKNVPVKQVLREIEKQCDMVFMYDATKTDVNKSISINVKNEKVENVLKTITQEIGARYEIRDKQIVLMPNEKASRTQVEQTGTRQGGGITGTIVDEKGEPIPGANVAVKGTTLGTMTDVDGKYSINVPDQKSVLMFSFVGYNSKEIVAGDKRIIDVTLSESLNQIDEVVVIGYGSEKKLTSTGAVSSMSSADVLRSPVPNIGNMLVGQVTGLSAIQTTAMPGADDPQILVRGIGTLNAASASPLILVDGVERSFFQLDPNEIESISILKDASSTAVFGVQGANGVIIVTTKRGQEGPPKITVSLSTGAQAPLRVLNFVDSYDFCIAYNELQQTNIFPDALMEKYKTNANPLLYPSHNWIKEVMKPFALQTQDNINISGGTANVKYFASLGYLYQNGLFKQFRSDINQNYNYTRYNYRTNFDIQATKSTKFSVSISGITGIREQPNNIESNNFDTAIFNELRWGLPFASGGIVDGKEILSNTRYIDPSGSLGLIRNPFMQWYGKGSRNITNNQMNVDLAFEQTLNAILKGLSVSVKYSYNNSYTHTKNRTYSVPKYTPWMIGDTDNWQAVDPTANPSDVVLVPSADDTEFWGYNEAYSNRSRTYYWEGSLRYNQTFGKHQVSGLFLGNMKKIFYKQSTGDFLNNYPAVPLGSAGLVGRASYNYAQKYLLEFDAGYNGSENFAPGKRFGFFPAASIGWVVSEESFMKKLPVVSFLKLRASIGEVGSDYVGNNRFLYFPNTWNPNDGVYYFGTNNNIVTMNGAHEKAMGYPDVTWETALKQNFGIDLSFLKGRLNLNGDLFFEKRRNILWDDATKAEYPAILLPVGNVGKVNNHGYEIAFKWTDKLGSNRKNSYWVGGNVSYSRNKIIAMAEIAQPYPWMQRTGQRVGQNFGYTFEGLYKASDFPDALIYNNGNLAPGDAKYKDLNHDNVIDAYDAGPIGYSKFPDYIFGFNAGFRYRGFDFSMLWQAATNVSKNLSSVYRIPFNTQMNYNLLQYTYDHRYVSETLTPDATYPRLASETRSWNYDGTTTNSLWVMDASYLRLKNIEIGYNISALALKKLGITNLRVYLNASNLLTFDKLVFIDPEESGNTTEYPNMATTNFGLTFNF